MAPPLLALRNIALTFGGTPLLTDANLQVTRGERICLVGRNGSGKSTLLKVAAGRVEPDSGERFIQPGTRVAVLAQEPDFGTAQTVGAYVAAAFDDERETYRADAFLDALELSPDLPTATLSGGEARRAALAKVLAPEPDVLMLDEPTNHLDLPAIEWLESTLDGLGAAIILISHDRRFLETLSQTTVWLDRGETKRLDKGFAHFEDWRDAEIEAEADAAHKLDRKIVREEHWLHGGISGRRKRNVKRLSDLHALRQKRDEARKQVGNVNFEASESEKSGALVIEAKGISKSFETGPSVVADLSLRIMRGDRLGIVGPNGAGKTTLIKLLIGEMEPDAGSIRHGSNIERIWLDQKRDSLAETDNVTDVLTGGRGDTVFINGRPKHVASYLKDFLFLPEQARSPVSVLSGGERARLLLAKALAQSSNLMVLDEPTNDLDLETLDLLQELLTDYSGTLLLVSHDRDFLDRICTSVLAKNETGQWTEYAGGYSDMIRQRKAEHGGANGQPKAAGPASKADAKPQAHAPTAKPKRKLSFKEKHALETLPARIESLEQEIATLETKLADPNLFTRDPDAFSRHTKRMTDATTELSDAEEQWLELEELRESLEG
jgi:ATP-binding cassette subfamily F protein uup